MKKNIIDEINLSIRALERVKNLSNISATAVKALDKDNLNIEDLEIVFKIIIEECEKIETSISNLEMLN